MQPNTPPPAPQPAQPIQPAVSNTPTPPPVAPRPLVDLPPSPSPLQLKKRRPKTKLLALLLAGLVVLLVALVAGGYVWYQSQLGSAHPGSQTKARLTVKNGATASVVAAELASQQLIKNQFAFELYYRFHHESGLKAGVYVLEKGMSVPQIVDHLEQGKPDEFSLTFLPGATLADAKKVLLQAGYASADIDAAFVKSYDHPLLKTRPAGADLEGFIYGDTYNFYTGASLDDVLTKLFDHMYDDVKARSLEQAYAAQGMTLYQGIIFASIVQSEVAHKSDMAHVSQVFHTRLSSDMPLGSDVTFIYGARKLGVAPSVDLDSPYNTRVRKGLPPTPISNPGIDALDAGAHPSATDDLFFVAGDDGTTYFSKTYEAHQRATQQYCHKNCELPSQ